MVFWKVAVALLGTFALVACSDSSPSPTAPSQFAAGPPSVHAPQVLVGGTPVQGRVKQGTNEPSLFRVHVEVPGGLSNVRRVVMEYSQPGRNHHRGPMMGGYAGTVDCYDDGTHGDDIPGDGIYHYADPADRIGCHGIDAPSGEYHYTFWCEDIYGQRSNSASVTVIRE